MLTAVPRYFGRLPDVLAGKAARPKAKRAHSGCEDESHRLSTDTVNIFRKHMLDTA